MDDTTWLGHSHKNAQAILDVATSFFELNGIQINAKKTVLITINNTDKDIPLSFGMPSEEIWPLSRNEDMWILSVYVSASGSPTLTTQCITTATETMCTILQRKAITDRQAAYIINSVLLPQILYRVTLTILPKSTINNITGKYTKLCKKKSQMPATTPNSVMHHRNMFGVKKLADVQSEEQISTLMLHLNNQGIVGETTCTCLLQLQIREAMAEVPTMVPTDVIPYHHCLISQVCQLMHDHGVTLDINMAPMLSLPRNAISILKWSNGTLERDVLFEVCKQGIFYQEQILENDSYLMSWQTLRKAFNIQTLTLPDWFRSLQNFVNRPTYTGNFLEWWMEQKSEELEHVSDEELDHLITNQPQPIALPSPPLLAPLNGTELEDNSDLEAHITSEERDVDMDNKTQADLAPQNRPMPLPVVPYMPRQLPTKTTQQQKQCKEQYLNQHAQHSSGNQDVFREGLGAEFEQAERKIAKEFASEELKWQKQWELDQTRQQQNWEQRSQEQRAQRTWQRQREQEQEKEWHAWQHRCREEQRERDREWQQV